jgi:hypothetical protein
LTDRIVTADYSRLRIATLLVPWNNNYFRIATLLVPWNKNYLRIATLLEAGQLILKLGNALYL